jgi:hypothetical protein
VSERARGAGGREHGPRGRISVDATHVRADALRVHADAARPRRREAGRARGAGGGSWSAQTHACVRADALIYPRGNFIMDARVRLSHGRPSGHRPSVRPQLSA